jgi:hypothetical protein
VIKMVGWCAWIRRTLGLFGEVYIFVLGRSVLWLRAVVVDGCWLPLTWVRCPCWQDVYTSRYFWSTLPLGWCWMRRVDRGEGCAGEVDLSRELLAVASPTGCCPGRRMACLLDGLFGCGVRCTIPVLHETSMVLKNCNAVVRDRRALNSDSLDSGLKHCRTMATTEW